MGIEKMVTGSDFFEAYVLPVLRIFNTWQGPSSLALEWSTDNEAGPVVFGVICSDLFAWGASDMEDLLSDDLPLLQQAVADLQSLSQDGTYHEADLLYCCRKRQMRPKTPYYASLPPATHALFDACGPVREA